MNLSFIWDISDKSKASKRKISIREKAADTRRETAAIFNGLQGLETQQALLFAGIEQRWEFFRYTLGEAPASSVSNMPKRIWKEKPKNK